MLEVVFDCMDIGSLVSLNVFNASALVKPDFSIACLQVANLVWSGRLESMGP